MSAFCDFLIQAVKGVVSSRVNWFTANSHHASAILDLCEKKQPFKLRVPETKAT